MSNIGNNAKEKKNTQTKSKISKEWSSKIP
jgi:hypothetical protein